MEKGIFEAVCIASFLHGIKVNRTAIDRPIPIQLPNGVVGELWLPIVFPEGNCQVLGEPFQIEGHNYYDYDWGYCDYYQRNGVSYDCCIVKSVVLKLFSCKDWDKTTLSGVRDEIKHYIESLFEIIYFFAPLCIDSMANTRFNQVLCGVDIFTQANGVDIKTPREYSLEINMDIPLSRWSIIWLLNRIGKTLKENYKAISYATVNYKMGDYRDAVLNCATAVEVTLNLKLKNYLSKTNTAQDIIEYILKKTNGYDKYKQLFMSLLISKINWGDLDLIMKMRNRVIHGGYGPSKNDALKIWHQTRAFLYKVDPRFFYL